MQDELVERVAGAIYTSAQEYNGNLSALPWRIVLQGAGMKDRWLHFAQVAIAEIERAALNQGKD